MAGRGGREGTGKAERAIVLASNSPRRRELLHLAGIVFVSDPSDVDEQHQPGEEPADYALRVARDKASTAAGRKGDAVVIAADTIVVLDGRILGKPAGPEEAERMLLSLSGREHRVITGLVVEDRAQQTVLERASETRVWFRDLSREEIRAYIASGEPLDKAGAYGIQGRAAPFVRRIDGCYFNVVGLPLSLLVDMLGAIGIYPPFSPY